VAAPMLPHFSPLLVMCKLSLPRSTPAELLLLLCALQLPYCILTSFHVK